MPGASSSATSGITNHLFMAALTMPSSQAMAGSRAAGHRVVRLYHSASRVAPRRASRECGVNARASRAGCFVAPLEQHRVRVEHARPARVRAVEMREQRAFRGAARRASRSSRWIRVASGDAR